MLGDCRKMSVALCCRGLARKGRGPGWDDDRGLRMAFGHGIVNSFAIIRAVCGHRRQVSIDLIAQLRNFGNVADILRRQFHSDDFMRVSINADVQLPPAAAQPDAVFLIQPFALAVLNAVLVLMLTTAILGPVLAERLAPRMLGDQAKPDRTSDPSRRAK